jgi:hypothetical protein
MKTTIEYLAGHVDVLPDVMPTITDNGEPGSFVLYLNNKDMEITSDDIPLDIVKRVIFEPENVK